ncbi:hypothetical protein [Mesorhizobium sp. LjNodule214]|uniref:hypothetical protein n=1 Tax=Mesorhizobium sp. LjNodule214 TaxID=3342252 RepID=UPI003ECCF904
MTKRPVIVDQRQADLRKIDGEIERLEKQIADKRAAVDADQAKHALDQNEEMQRRLETQIRALRGHVDEMHKKRFDVELGDLAEPKRQPAAAAPAAKVRKQWDLKPVQAVGYPDLPRTEENQKTFAETFERFTNYMIYLKQLGLKEADCHPDSIVHLDLLAMIAAQAEAGEVWNALRLAAVEDRLAELESRPTLKYAGVWSASTTYIPGEIVSHGGSSWHANIKSTGLQPGEGNPASWTLMTKRGRDGKDART